MMITVDGKKLVLDDKIQIRLEYNMPLFNTNEIPPSIVYPFNIPDDAEGVNAQIFRHAKYIETWNRKRLYNCKINLLGLYDLRGALILNSFNGSYRVSVLIDKDIDGFADKKLSEFDYKNIKTDVIHYANTAINNVWPDIPVQFPTIFNPDFYGERKINEDGSIDSNNPAYGEYMNKYDSTNSTFQRNMAEGNINVLCPQLYLFELLQTVFNAYKIVGDFWTDNEQRSLLLYSNISLDARKRGIVKARRNVKEQINSEFLSFPNDIYDAQKLFNTESYTVGRAGVHIIDISVMVGMDISKMTLRETGWHFEVYLYVKDQIYDKVSVKVEKREESSGPGEEVYYKTVNFNKTIELTEDDIGTKIYLCTDFRTGKPGVYGYDDDRGVGYFRRGSLSIINEGGSIINDYDNQIDVKLLVPKITVGELLNTIRKNLGLSIFINSQRKEIDFSYSKEIIKSDKYLDITDYLLNEFEHQFQDEKLWKVFFKEGTDDKAYIQKPEIRKLIGKYESISKLPIPVSNVSAKVKFDNKIFTANYDDSANLVWEEYSDDICPRFYGKGKIEEYPLGVSPMLMNDGYPYIKNSGITSAFKCDADFPNFRMFYYRGIADGVPSASSTEFNKAAQIVGNNAQTLDGIMENNLLSYFEYMSNASIIKYSLIPEMCLMKLMSLIEIFKPGHSVRKVKCGNSIMIPKKLTIVAKMSDIKDIRIECVKKNGAYE